MRLSGRQGLMVGALGAAALLLSGLSRPPALDEESYLWLGQQVGLGAPYDWSRSWPPWEGTGFIYAHPPLFLWWMGVWGSLELPLWALRMAVGLPWALLFGASSGLLAERSCRHPLDALLCFGASPLLWLGLQNSLMIDLPALALWTAALAAWRVGCEASSGWFLLSGLFLGLGMITKYPVGFLVPALFLHLFYEVPSEQRRTASMGLLLALFILGLLELGLWFSYGKLHLWEVWSQRDAIPSGPFEARGLGILARAGLILLPLGLFWSRPRILGFGLLIGALVGLGAGGLGGGERLWLGLLSSCGAAFVLRAITGMGGSRQRRRKGDKGDALLLGGSALSCLLGVWFFHNFASARYLLPAVVPLLILTVRSAEEIPKGKWASRLGVGLSALGAVLLATADLRFLRASLEVAETAAMDRLPGVFEGEWTGRWALEKRGWKRRVPGQAIAVGTQVILLHNAAANLEIPANWEPLREVESKESFWLRVIGGNIGLYSETIGILPVGIGEGPLSGAVVFEVRGESEK